MDTSDVLRNLIRACVDDEHTLRHESTLVDAKRAETLTRLARERGQFVADLERLGNREESHDGSWREFSREAGRDVWAAAAGVNTGDSIAVCRHSRARTAAVYDEAMQVSWPADISLVLAAQQRSLHDEADELDRLQ